MAVWYGKTPLIEAVFEFSPESAVLDDEAAATLAAELQHEYSGKHDEQQFISLRFDLAQGTAQRKQKPQQMRYRRWNTLGTRLVQVSRDLCAFNALAPYTHYVDYLPAME